MGRPPLSRRGRSWHRLYLRESLIRTRPRASNRPLENLPRLRDVLLVLGSADGNEAGVGVVVVLGKQLEVVGVLSMRPNHCDTLHGGYMGQKLAQNERATLCANNAWKTINSEFNSFLSPSSIVDQDIHGAETGLNRKNPRLFVQTKPGKQSTLNIILFRDHRQ